MFLFASDWANVALLAVFKFAIFFLVGMSWEVLLNPERTFE